jgi:hypothetical protein
MNDLAVRFMSLVSFASIFARLGRVRLSGNTGSVARGVAGVGTGVVQSCGDRRFEINARRIRGP